jgi:hypothetical protein
MPLFAVYVAVDVFSVNLHSIISQYVASHKLVPILVPDQLVALTCLHKLYAFMIVLLNLPHE